MKKFPVLPLNFIQGLQAVRRKPWADHVHLLVSFCCDLLQSLIAVRLQPLRRTEAGLEDHIELFFPKLQLLCQQSGGLGAKARIGISLFDQIRRNSVKRHDQPSAFACLRPVAFNTRSQRLDVRWVVTVSRHKAKMGKHSPALSTCFSVFLLPCQFLSDNIKNRRRGGCTGLRVEGEDQNVTAPLLPQFPQSGSNGRRAVTHGPLHKHTRPLHGDRKGLVPFLPFPFRCPALYCPVSSVNNVLQSCYLSLRY
mmetsp:Transcript_20856/g.41597  ORF Transcript_20856/g.41597 Transcript_20856/m.41597 type:complete len:252 (-) Transcript_20856:590-1345(-)